MVKPVFEYDFVLWNPIYYTDSLVIKRVQTNLSGLLLTIPCQLSDYTPVTRVYLICSTLLISIISLIVFFFLNLYPIWLTLLIYYLLSPPKFPLVLWEIALFIVCLFLSLIIYIKDSSLFYFIYFLLLLKKYIDN